MLAVRGGASGCQCVPVCATGQRKLYIRDSRNGLPARRGLILKLQISSNIFLETELFCHIKLSDFSDSLLTVIVGISMMKWIPIHNMCDDVEAVFVRLFECNDNMCHILCGRFIRSPILC